jgi:hypothetical protein
MTPAPNCCSGWSPPHTNAGRWVSARTGPSTRGRFLPEHTTAVSLLDRLLHHSNVVVTEGESFRMRQARNRGGARPKKT